MEVQVICVPVVRGFLSLVWLGKKEDPPPEGRISIYHANIMDLLSDGILESPECLKVSDGATYWQAHCKGLPGEYTTGSTSPCS